MKTNFPKLNLEDKACNRVRKKYGNTNISMMIVKEIFNEAANSVFEYQLYYPTGTN